MAEFKPFEMIMRIEYGGAVEDGDVMQVCCKAKPVAELVRCKDCKHWERDVVFSDGWCRGKHQGNPDWFCADGEREVQDGE